MSPEIWRKLGKFFGYPQCCIDAFVERSTAILTGKELKPYTKDQKRVIDHSSGFVPCDSCSSKLVGPGDKHTLIKNRIAKDPYPYVDREDMDKYLANN